MNEPNNVLSMPTVSTLIIGCKSPAEIDENTSIAQPLAFQPLDIQDGDLGVSLPGNQAKRRAVGWGGAAKTNRS
jgi:hypothetical protein